MGTAREVGLLTAPLTLVRAPVRISLRAAEFGLSTAAEAARIGTELLNPDRGASRDFAGYPRNLSIRPATGVRPTCGGRADARR